MNSLSLTLDDKTKFQLEFAARVSGLPTTQFIEKVIKKSS